MEERCRSIGRLPASDYFPHPMPDLISTPCLNLRIGDLSAFQIFIIASFALSLIPLFRFILSDEMAVITINVRSNGHDWGAPNLDGLGIFYIVLAVVYALVVLAGLFALWLNRDKTPVRLRSVWVIAPTVLLLLTYCVWVVIVYPLNGLFKCGAEYWVMSCFFPTSIALFQGMRG